MVNLRLIVYLIINPPDRREKGQYDRTAIVGTQVKRELCDTDDIVLTIKRGSPGRLYTL